MIQRIQSIYLLSSCALIALLFLNPFIVYTTAHSNIAFNVFGFIENGSPVLRTIPMIILVAVSGLVNLVCFFSYKNRLLQIRLCILNIVLLFGMYALPIFYIFTKINFNAQYVATYKISVVFPFVAIVFTYLALRAIGKDEAIVRSVDRIR